MAFANYPKVVLPVKRNLQDLHYDCGPASLVIILASLGMEITEEQLLKAAHTTNDGTSPEKLLHVLKHYHIQFEAIEHGNLELLEEKIRALHLVLVDYQAWAVGDETARLESGHYSVIFGFNKTHLWVADPAKHHTQTYQKWGARKIRKDIFLSHWKDKEADGTLTRHWMVAVPLYQKMKKDSK